MDRETEAFDTSSLHPGTRAFYDAFAGVYEATAGDEAGRTWAAGLAPMLRGHVSPGARVLDLGAGTGLGGLMLRELRPKLLVGLDFSEEMLNRARGRYDALVASDIRSLPFSAGAFDFCVAGFDTMNHLSGAEIQRFLRALAQTRIARRFAFDYFLADDAGRIAHPDLNAAYYKLSGLEGGRIITSRHHLPGSGLVELQHYLPNERWLHEVALGDEWSIQAAADFSLRPGKAHGVHRAYLLRANHP